VLHPKGVEQSQFFPGNSTSIIIYLTLNTFIIPIDTKQ